MGVLGDISVPMASKYTARIAASIIRFASSDLTERSPMLFRASMSGTSEPARRRRNDRSEAPVSFLPEGNPAARRAYLFALAGLAPGLGIICGPLATVFGIVGLRAAERDKDKRGRGHAFLSRLLGPIEFVCNAAGLACLAHALNYF